MSLFECKIDIRTRIGLFCLPFLLFLLFYLSIVFEGTCSVKT